MQTPRSPVALIAVVLVLAACGRVANQAADAAGPIDAAASSDAAWGPDCKAPGDAEIAAVETADPSVAHGCIQGHWFLQATSGMTTPDAPDQPNNTVAVSPVLLSSQFDTLDPMSTYAIHVIGSGQSMPGFAHLFVSLNAPSETQVGTVDAAAFTGVQFYAIVKAPSGASFGVGDMDTDVSFGRCILMAGQKNCGDRPRKMIDASTTWTLYQARFDELMQLGIGNPTPTGADFPKNAITVLEWAIGIPSTGSVGQWELWIDDVKFY